MIQGSRRQRDQFPASKQRREEKRTSFREKNKESDREEDRATRSDGLCRSRGGKQVLQDGKEEGRVRKNKTNER